jgi:hypothetical protein
MSNVGGSTRACKTDFVAELVVFVSRGSGAAWDCWMRAVFDCVRYFRRLKTGLLAVADGGSAMAQETAQDMGLDQFLEVGEAAGGLVAEGEFDGFHAWRFGNKDADSASRVGAGRPVWCRAPDSPPAAAMLR